MRPWLVALAATLVVLAAGCSSGDDAPTQGASAGTAGESTSAPDELAHRAVHTLTTLTDGAHLVVGGCVVDGCSTATDSVYRLGPDGPEPAAPLHQARDGHTATLLADGRVLVLGGYAGEGSPPLVSAEVYDPAEDAWQQVGELTLGRGGHAAALLGDGRVLVSGGWVAPGQNTATTEIFDPETGSFVPGPDLTTAVDGLAATSLQDGSVLVVGGTTDGTASVSTAVRVRPDGSVTEVDALGTGRFKHTVVTLPTGEALVLGGTTNDRHLLRSTEVFNPATDRFRAGPSLRSGRYKLSGSAAVLPHGRVVVAGGGPGVEVVDVERGRSSVVAEAGQDWASFSTVGVADDRLVVLGGYDREIRLTGTQVTLPLADL